MGQIKLVRQTSLMRFTIVFVVCLFAAISPASASVIYNFSLPANGDIGAVNIQLTFADFLPQAPLFVLGLDAPEVTSVTAAPPIDLANSVIGIDVTATETLIGIRLVDFAPNVTLFTVDYPADFFVFSRTPAEGGAFASTSGFVVSDFNLATRAPTGSLVVTPEPSTALFLGLGLAGFAAMRRFRKGSA